MSSDIVHMPGVWFTHKFVHERACVLVCEQAEEAKKKQNVFAALSSFVLAAQERSENWGTMSCCSSALSRCGWIDKHAISLRTLAFCVTNKSLH